jgi:hypothetical protein
MYLRTSRQKRADGSVITHYQLAESVWDQEVQRSRTRIVYSFGRADDPAVVERLQMLARSESYDVKSMVRLSGAQAANKALCVKLVARHVPAGESRPVTVFAYWSADTAGR